jgi:hypothetical protein
VIGAWQRRPKSGGVAALAVRRTTGIHGPGGPKG